MSARIIHLSIFFLFSFLPLCGFSQGQEEPPYKLKIDLSNVLLERDGMYTLVNGQPIPIFSLQFENGEYTATSPASLIGDILGVWWCYNCQNWNSRFDTACIYCGRPK